MTRVAFAGLSALRERIVTEALGRSEDIQVIAPWTSLGALRASEGVDASTDILFIELAEGRLPEALRAMLAAASRLRIIALSMDARRATVYELREHQTIMLQCVADDLCAAITATAPAARTRKV
jgi:DNA-binding NarL/FixJ family response regulator